jgi:MFS family permease
LNPSTSQKTASNSQIAFASFIGTAIEFYDFYIYAMAAALVIGPVFFPSSDPAAQALNAFLSFGIAFFARPLGAILFGHFGRMGAAIAVLTARGPRHRLGRRMGWRRLAGNRECASA